MGNAQYSVKAHTHTHTQAHAVFYSSQLLWQGCLVPMPLILNYTVFFTVLRQKEKKNRAKEVF